MGDVVKVYSTIHTALFRAKVLRNNKDGSYKVFYIDYGNMETVSSDDIYELADELKKVILENKFLFCYYIKYLM